MKNFNILLMTVLTSCLISDKQEVKKSEVAPKDVSMK